MNILSLLTWWKGQTLGTELFTRRHGQKVGEDELGNTYYQTADGKRRWVLYEGENDASVVSPAWHGWLHHTFDEAPGTTPLTHKDWEKPHIPNMTGSDAAYHPPGSVFTAQTRDKVRGDYEAWQPE